MRKALLLALPFAALLFTGCAVHVHSGPVVVPPPPAGGVVVPPPPAGGVVVPPPEDAPVGDHRLAVVGFQPVPV